MCSLMLHQPSLLRDLQLEEPKKYEFWYVHRLKQTKLYLAA